MGFLDESGLNTVVEKLKENLILKSSKTIKSIKPLYAGNSNYAYPPMSISVKGKTVQNLWVNCVDTTMQGITISNQSDGSVNLSGTATGQVNLHSKQIYNLKPGNKYFIACYPTTSNFNVGISQYKDGAFVSTLRLPANSSYAVITLSEDVTSFTCVFYGFSTTTAVSGNYRVMLREAIEDEINLYENSSTTLPEGLDTDESSNTPTTLPYYPEPLSESSTFWAPPGLTSINEITLHISNKNVCPKFSSKTAFGVTFEVLEDNSIHVKGVPENNNTYTAVNNYPLKEGATYTASSNGGGATSISSGGAFLRINIRKNGIYSRAIDCYGTTPKTFTTQIGENRADILIYCGNNLTDYRDVILYPQIEVGNESTKYEPPLNSSIRLELADNVLSSLPDGTSDTLIINPSGEVSVIKNTYYVKLTGSENWIKSTASFNGYFVYTSAFGFPSNSPGMSKLVSTSFKTVSDKNEYLTDPWYALLDSAICLSMPTSSISSADQMKTWLASNNQDVVYGLKDSQLIELGTITLPKTQQDYTNVWISSNLPDIEYEVNTDYWKDYLVKDDSISNIWVKFLVEYLDGTSDEYILYPNSGVVYASNEDAIKYLGI